MMNEEKAKWMLDELVQAGDLIADQALEFEQDQQVGEARRYRERAANLYTAACLIASAFPENRQRVTATIRLAALAADEGDRKGAQGLLTRAERLAGTEEDTQDLIAQIEIERKAVAS